MQWCACGVQRSGCSSHSDYRLSGDCQPEHTTRTRQCAKLFSSNLLEGVFLPKLLLLVGHPHVFGQCYVPLIQNTTWTLDACDAMLIHRSLLLLVKHKGLSFKTKHTTRHLQSVLWGGAADRVQSVCRVCGKDEMRQRFLYRLNARACSWRFAFQNKVRQN